VDQKPAKVSVIIPMYNEEENAANTVRSIEEKLSAAGCDFEIIPVNDGSTDNTLRVLDNIAEHDPRVRVVSYWKNGGRGKAIRYGFAAASGEYITTIDADLSYNPSHILDMIRVLDEESDIDVVLISAYMKGGKTEGVPKRRLFISRLGNRILSLAMTEPVHTITCIARCYRRNVVESLDLESNGKEIHLEILSKVLAMGYGVKEIPGVLRSRTRGRSKFVFRSTAISHLLFTIVERPILLFGFIGILLTIVGLGIGVYILDLYYTKALNPNRPLITLMIVFILGGIQILSFGFIASQMNYLRKEILRLRKTLFKLKSIPRRKQDSKRPFV